MANKEKKISVNTLEDTINDYFIKTNTIEWKGLQIEVKRTIGYKDMTDFVNTVVKCCFDEHTEEFKPERKDFLIRASVLMLYTNLRMPSNLQKQYSVVYGNDLVSCVINEIDHDQFTAILDAIDEKITHLASANISAVNRELGILTENFSVLQNNVATLFDGINNDDIRSIAGSITDNGFDGEKLMKAYINARYNAGTDDDEERADDAE